MKMKKIFIWSAIIVSILGTLLHFAYDWSGQNTLVGLFTPVNESTWEHMKLIFFPTLIVNIFIWRKLHDKLPYLDSSLPAWLLIGTWLIPALFPLFIKTLLEMCDTFQSISQATRLHWPDWSRAM